MRMRLMTALAVTALASITSLVQAEEVAGGGDANCHALMTKKECVAHAATLTLLPPGAERDGYILAHEQMLRDREASCACSRNIKEETPSAKARIVARKPALPRF
jgi:hypothetical protein